MNSAARQSDRVLGNYILERQLGVGGMGVVFAARHRQLGHRVAIKLMHPELVNADLVERFTREGQAAARLRSPHVARVLDVGVDDTGAPYLTMEFLDGKDLDQVLQQNGALPLEQAIDYLLQIGEAVAEAHSAGIVHRDLKPGNLFLARDAYGNECVKVLDFGISKLIDDDRYVDSPKLTAAATVIGTPHYMPPEQMRSAHEADARSDIWALGAIFFEMLTAMPAWSGATLSEVCMRVASDPAPQARDRCSSLPPLVDVVISTCLRKDPAQRYQSVIDLIAALAPLAPELVNAALERIARLIGTVAPLTLASEIGGPSSTLASSGIGVSTSKRPVRLIGNQP
ncbi:MAG TPA: serine/threonine-protein kinase, partial [Polyangiaceae bacterium]